MKYQKIERIANKDQADEIYRLRDLARAAARVVKATHEQKIRPEYALELLRKAIDAGVVEEYSQSTVDCMMSLHQWWEDPDIGLRFDRHAYKSAQLTIAILEDEVDYMDSLVDEWFGR